MPLDWLEQLGPTMQQQIALQRALLALQREDEQIRAKTMPQATQPALARGLAPSPGPAIPGGPSYKEQPPSPLAAGPAAVGHFRPGAGGLEEALRVATPATGSAIDIQGQAWAKRKEMVEERVVGAKDAYDRIITLDPEGQKVALDAVRKYKPAVYKAMETEGYLSPAGELVKPAKEKVFGETSVDPQSGEVLMIYKDGTIERTGMFVPPEEEEVAGKLTPSEELGWARLNFDVAKEGVGNILEAIKNAGGIIVEGDMIKRPGENEYRAARPEDVQRRYDKVKANLDYQKVVTEGPKSIGDLKIMFEHDPEAVKNLQRNAGITVDGVWSDALGQWLWDNFYKEG